LTAISGACLGAYFSLIVLQSKNEPPLSWVWSAFQGVAVFLSLYTGSLAFDRLPVAVEMGAGLVVTLISVFADPRNREFFNRIV